MIKQQLDQIGRTAFHALFVNGSRPLPNSVQVSQAIHRLQTETMKAFADEVTRRGPYNQTLALLVSELGLNPPTPVVVPPPPPELPPPPPPAAAKATAPAPAPEPKPEPAPGPPPFKRPMRRRVVTASESGLTETAEEAKPEPPSPLELE